MVRIALFLAVLMSSSEATLAQEMIFLMPDKVPNCAMIKHGVFKSSDYSIEQYYIVAKQDTVFEFVSEGKYYVKTKREFTTDCSYKSTVIEVTIPDYNVKPGTIIQADILETECNFIKMKVKMGIKEIITVLEKQED